MILTLAIRKMFGLVLELLSLLCTCIQQLLVCGRVSPDSPLMEGQDLVGDLITGDVEDANVNAGPRRVEVLEEPSQLSGAMGIGT